MVLSSTLAACYWPLFAAGGDTATVPRTRAACQFQLANATAVSKRRVSGDWHEVIQIFVFIN